MDHNHTLVFDNASWITLIFLVLVWIAVAQNAAAQRAVAQEMPSFVHHQPDLFRDGGALTNAFADYDNDGDLDLFVGFNNKPSRLYRNDDGTFVDVAQQVGLTDAKATRATAWGDYDGDGNLDLFLGFASREESESKLYRNDGDGVHFTDVTAAAGVSLTGSFRQPSWVDYDNDGDVDLFVGFRDKSNALLRNTDGHFEDVAAETGIDDDRRTVGAAWFDYDKDGDLDCIVANMDGDANGLFRNDGGIFVDVAGDAGIVDGGRPLGLPEYGSVRPVPGDYDNDGEIDIFIVNYGPNGLFRNLGNGTFENVASRLGLAIDSRYDTGMFGDFDNDGRIDLYVNGTVSGGKNYEDYLFRNTGDAFIDVTPSIIKNNDSDHGAQWADFDQDGDLDLALTGAPLDKMHHILRNVLDPDRTSKSLEITVLDGDGHYTRAGTEVRLYLASSSTLLGTRVLDTGSGYNSQNAMPVHFGLGKAGHVDVEITVLTRNGRTSGWIKDVDPTALPRHQLSVKINSSGDVVK